jgi:hypothetical protein
VHILHEPAARVGVSRVAELALRVKLTAEEAEVTASATSLFPHEELLLGMKTAVSPAIVLPVIVKVCPLTPEITLGVIPLMVAKADVAVPATTTAAVTVAAMPTRRGRKPALVLDLRMRGPPTVFRTALRNG